MENNIPKTYKEALEQGYRAVETSWQRGYVSRNTDIGNAPVRVAGGSRKGMLYVLLPSYRSTLYCIRQYLVK